MESFVRYLVFFMALSCAQALTPTECRNASDNCQAEFIKTLSQQGNVSFICSGARRSLGCVQQLACESDMYLRIAIRVTTRRLSENRIHSCELGTHFPKDKEYSSECQQKRATCFNSYVDNLLNHTADDPLHHTNHTGHVSWPCQDLNTFASCMVKKDSCELKKEEIGKTVSEEKLRLLLPDCAVDGFNRGSLTILSQVFWLSTLLTLALTVN
ncbi:hypothetical protein BsWGS_13850 [Bradybaena similaris]